MYNVSIGQKLKNNREQYKKKKKKKTTDVFLFVYYFRFCKMLRRVPSLKVIPFSLKSYSINTNIGANTSYGIQQYTYTYAYI